MKGIIVTLIVIISAYTFFSMVNVQEVIEQRENNINIAVRNAMK